MVRNRVPRRIDMKGRSRKIDNRFAPKNSPADLEYTQWCWLPRELMLSPAWRSISMNTRKLIDRLLLEHVEHAGTENGRLIVTHDNLIEYGLTACTIRQSLEEARAFGLIAFKQGGRWGGSNYPNIYRLTWLGWWDEDDGRRDPTNEWKGVSEELIASYRAERQRIRSAKRSRRENLKTGQTPESSRVIPLNVAARKAK